MSEQVDLAQLAKLIDAALGSNNPSVKKALRNFLLVASIVESENENNLPGPFADYFAKVDELSRKINHLEDQLNFKTRTKDSYYDISKWTGPTYTTGTSYTPPSTSYTTSTIDSNELLDLYMKYGKSSI